MNDNDSTYYRRNLPHFQPTGAAFFVTFRLAGSMPQEAIQRLTEEHRLEKKQLQTLKNPESARRE
jgi:putative transposase